LSGAGQFLLIDLQPKGGPLITHGMFAIANVWSLCLVLPVLNILAETSANVVPKGAILPNGRSIEPKGKRLWLLTFPFALTVYPDGKRARVIQLSAENLR
jgi:hypothetical protein